MAQQILDKYRSVIGYINYVLCLVLLFFASAQDSTLRFLFNAWIISWALEFRWLDMKNFTFRKYDKSLLLLLAFVGVEALTLLWTSNVDYGVRRFVKHLYFVVITLICLFGVNERYKLKSMMYVYVAGAVIVGCCYFIVVYHVLNGAVLSDLSHNYDLVMPSMSSMADVIHHNKLHQNLGLSLTLALVVVPFARRSLIKDIGALNAYVMISFVVVVIILCIFFSGCRSSLIVLFACLLVGVMFRMRTKGRIWALGITMVLSISLFSLLKHHPRSENVSFELSKCITGNFEGNEEHRIMIWHGVFKICSESFFFGSGLGSSCDRLVEFYNRSNYPEYYAQLRLSSHSQYFEVLLEMGVFALIGFVALLAMFPYYFEGKARMFAVFVMAMYAIQGLTDAILGGCTGIMVFCIAVLFCMMLANEQLKMESKS